MTDADSYTCPDCDEQACVCAFYEPTREELDARAVRARFFDVQLPWESDADVDARIEADVSLVRVVAARHAWALVRRVALEGAA